MSLKKPPEEMPPSSHRLSTRIAFSRAHRMAAGLVVRQLVVWGGAFVFATVLAPFGLQLDPLEVAALRSPVSAASLLFVLLSVANTVRLWNDAPALQLALNGANDWDAVRDLERAADLPRRLVLTQLPLGLLLVATWLLPWDGTREVRTTSLALVCVLAVAALATGGIAVFVLLRARLADILAEVPSPDLTPPARSSAQAPNKQETWQRGLSYRIHLTIGGPVVVATLALGLFLASGELRDYERARVTLAEELAQCILKPAALDTDGNPEPQKDDVLASTSLNKVRDASSRTRDSEATWRELINQAKSLGFNISIEQGAPPPSSTRTGRNFRYEGSVLYAELPSRDDEIAQYLKLSIYGPNRRAGSIVGLGMVLVCAAVACWAVGRSLSKRYEGDVAFAERQIVRIAGMSEDLESSRMALELSKNSADRTEARTQFAEPFALLQSIDRLGLVFAQFARTTRRAIVTRERTERMRAMFLAAMSHDLKSPLNAVLGFADLLAMDALNSAQQESLDIVSRRGRELLHILNVILEHARLEERPLRLDREACTLDSIWRKTVDFAVFLNAPNETSIRVHGGPFHCHGRWDRRYLQLGITCALHASTKLASSGATVDVHLDERVTEDSTEARMLIVIPVRKETSQHATTAIQAFRQASAARKHGSLGLSLNLGERILAAHGGTLHSEPHELGDGTRGELQITVTLPAISAKTIAANETQ
jgi:signal transduction histidine kinase